MSWGLKRHVAIVKIDNCINFLKIKNIQSVKRIDRVFDLLQKKSNFDII